MSLLIDRAPEAVQIDGAEIPINSDFRTSVLFEQLMFDEDISDSLKASAALNLYYPKLPPNIEEATERLLWFYSGGREKNTGEKIRGYAQGRCYDFEYDDEYIFSAFLQQYGIDLESIKYLHWWKFRAMLRSLSEDCEIIKIIKYRTMKIDSKMSVKERQFYTKMKRLYSLPHSRSEIEKINEIEKALMKK